MEEVYQNFKVQVVDQDDHSKLVFHLSKIIKKWSTLSTDEIAKILDEYIEDTDIEPHAEFVQRLKTAFVSGAVDPEEFLNFLQLFVGQKYPIDAFYKRYRSTLARPPAFDLFGDEPEDLTSDEENANLLQRRRLDAGVNVVPRRSLLLVDDEPVEQIGIPGEFMRRTAREQGLSERLGLSERQRRRVLKGRAGEKTCKIMAGLDHVDCEFLHKKIPWVKDVVNQIYVYPVKGNFADVIDLENFIVYKEDRYYQPKKKYYYLQCDSVKTQKGKVLTVKKDGQIYKMMVALDTASKGVILQNEDMLKAEVDYLLNWKSAKARFLKISDTEKPGPEMIASAKSALMVSLRVALRDNVPVAYRSAGGPFIVEVIDTMLKHSETGKDFVRMLVNLTVFLEINLSFVSCSVFVKRLRQQIYLPGTLPFLTDADKLPEIFLNRDVPDNTIKLVLEKLEAKRANMTSEFKKMVHYYLHTSLQSISKSVRWSNDYGVVVQRVELPDIKTMCKNKDDFKDESDQNMLYYVESDDVYCFNVYDLYPRLSRGQTDNPYTKQPFSPEFIQSCLKLYATLKPMANFKNRPRLDIVEELEMLIDEQLTLLENRLIETFAPMNTGVPEAGLTTGVPEAGDAQKCSECKNKIEIDHEKIRTFFRNKEVVFCGYECLEKNKNFK